MAKCIECSLLGLREHPKHANVGLGRCKADLQGVFVAITRNAPCESFKQAPMDIVLKRMAFIEGKP